MPGGLTQDPPAQVRLAEAVSALGWSADGSVLAAADLGGGLALVEAAGDGSLQVTGSHPAHRGGATTLAWHPRRRLLATGGIDGQVRLYGEGSLGGFTVGGWVRAMAWSPEGNLLAVAGGAAVVVVDPAGAHVAAFPCLAGTVHDLAWIDGPAPLAAAAGTAVAWLDLRFDGEPLEQWTVRGAAMVLAPDARRERLAIGELAGSVRVVDVADGAETLITGWSQRLRALCWSTDGRWLVAAAGEEIRLWRVRELELVGEEPIRLRGHAAMVTALAAGGTGEGALASGGDDGVLAVWPAGRLHDPQVLTVGAPVRRLAWRPGGDAVAVGTADGRVCLHQIAGRGAP